VTIAVDTRRRTLALVGEVALVPGIGLITLERACLLHDGVAALTLPADLQEATRLTGSWAARTGSMGLWQPSSSAATPTSR